MDPRFVFTSLLIYSIFGLLSFPPRSDAFPLIRRALIVLDGLADGGLFSRFALQTYAVSLRIRWDFFRPCYIVPTVVFFAPTSRSGVDPDLPITNLSLVSNSFRKLVASPELYMRRSMLGCAEHCLYAVVYDYESKADLLYIHHRQKNNNRLVRVRSLPGVSYLRSYVPVGSKIYVFNELDTFSIDCRSRTVQPISVIPKTMYRNVAGFIGGKIYVIGDYYCGDDEVLRKGILVFDTETQIWEPKMRKTHVETGVVAMEDKIYIRDLMNSFVYEPKKNKWEMDETLNSRDWKNASVLDDVLYYYEVSDNKLRAYNPKQRCWTVVKGLEALLPKTTSVWWSHTVSYGGKLALYFSKYECSRNIWCAEIALERRRGGEIWGKVEWCFETHQ